MIFDSTSGQITSKDISSHAVLIIVINFRCSVLHANRTLQYTVNSQCPGEYGGHIICQKLPECSSNQRQPKDSVLSFWKNTSLLGHMQFMNGLQIVMKQYNSQFCI